MRKMKCGGNKTTRLYGYHIEKETFTFKEDKAKVITFIFIVIFKNLDTNRLFRCLRIIRFHHQSEMKSGVSQPSKQYLPMKSIQVTSASKDALWKVDKEC